MKNKQKLIESSKDWNNLPSILPIKLNESNNKVRLGEMSRSVCEAYKVPVWKLGEKNLNGRVYLLSLGEKVCRENKVTYALDGHPSDDYDPSYADVKAIGKNPEMIGNTLYVECYFVDEEYAKKVKEIMKHTGVGLSSSGYGELNDKSEVITETYDLERYFDFVLDPSYGVFMNEGDRVMGESEIKKEEKVITNNNKDSAINEKNINDHKEKTMSDKVSTVREDFELKKSIERYLKEATGIESPKLRKVELDQLASLFDEFHDTSSEVYTTVDVAYKNIVESTDKELSALIEKGTELEGTVKSLEEANKTISEKDAQLEELTRKVELAFEEMDKGKSTYQTLKAMYEEKSEASESVLSFNESEAKEVLDKLKQLESVQAKYKIACEMLDEAKKAIKKEVEDDSEKEDDAEKVEETEEKEGDEKDSDSEEKPTKKEESKKEETDDEEEDGDKVEESEEGDSKEDKTPEEGEDKEEPKKEKKKESFLNKLDMSKQQSEVQAYYESLHDTHGQKIEEFEKFISSARTRNEAVSRFIKIRPQLNEKNGTSLNRRNILDRTESIKESLEEQGVATGLNINRMKNKGWL